ncbi:hypothetical protein GDO81_019191 [Engystomops pustulosus]|uniref:Secreted protein n=1 Tax=Engystomops pustulosus TaxID=76066 RepID=A0AAV6YH28_ENGPU|nr:hypothetical protein GDO81_019191 [Engystomops pustulosus]
MLLALIFCAPETLRLPWVLGVAAEVTSLRPWLRADLLTPSVLAGNWFLLPPAGLVRETGAWDFPAGFIPQNPLPPWGGESRPGRIGFAPGGAGAQSKTTTPVSSSAHNEMHSLFCCWCNHCVHT